jgi:hypothetical protein
MRQQHASNIKIRRRVQPQKTQPAPYLTRRTDSRNTHIRCLDFADDRLRTFSIVLVGNQIAEYALPAMASSPRPGRAKRPVMRGCPDRVRLLRRSPGPGDPGGSWSCRPMGTCRCGSVDVGAANASNHGMADQTRCRSTRGRRAVNERVISRKRAPLTRPPSRARRGLHARQPTSSPPEGGVAASSEDRRGRHPAGPLPRPTGHGRPGSALSILRSGPGPERTRQRPRCPTRSRRCRSRWRRSLGRTRGRSSRRRKSWS